VNKLPELKKTGISKKSS